jgi:hypothetical protein
MYNTSVMNFTGVIYKKDDEYVIILEGEDFRFQEHVKDVTKANLRKHFKRVIYNRIIKALLEWEGQIRAFELSNSSLQVRCLWKHATTGQIYQSEYYEKLWEATH